MREGFVHLRNLFRPDPGDQPPVQFDADQDDIVQELQERRARYVQVTRKALRDANRERRSRELRGNPIADAAFPPRRQAP